MTLSRFVRFPLTRIVIACCALGGASFGTQVTLLRMGLVRALYDAAASPYLYSVSTLLAFVASYVVYVRVVERRSVGELAPAKGPVDLGAGFLLGTGLFTITIGSIWLAGCYEVTGFVGIRAAAPWLVLSLASGFAEEILVRGVIFRITEEGLGTWIALAISSLLFGMAHIHNPGATVLSGLAVALEAGVLAAGFVLTRRLWLPIGLHAGWNFVQGGVFGVAVSGFQFGGILKSGLHGPEILSGGAFGAEASIFAVVYCLVAGVCLLVAARRAGRFVPPFWARPRGGTPAAALILAARGDGAPTPQRSRIHAMKPTFRLAEHSDVDRLIVYMRQLYVHDGTPFDEPAARRALDGVVRDRSLGRVWMIGDGRDTVGYVVLTLGYSLEYRGRDAFVDELFIDAGRRRQGLGSRALRFVEQACRDLGVRALHLEAERMNVAAQALYRRHGFLDHDRYLMTKWIED